MLKDYRYDKGKKPWRQTKSTQNNVIERFWPELNSRVNYPIKRAMLQISDAEEYDMTDPVVKYCFSWLTIFVAKDATQHLLQSWNHHRVPGPGGCVPIQNMIETKRTVNLIEPLIPTTPEAVRMYEELGGRLTRDSRFGYDPLGAVEHAYESRLVLFQQNQPTGKELFRNIVHGDFFLLERAVEYFYRLTIDLGNNFGL